jgi:hypothetical protein
MPFNSLYIHCASKYLGLFHELIEGKEVPSSKYELTIYNDSDKRILPVEFTCLVKASNENDLYITENLSDATVWLNHQEELQFTIIIQNRTTINHMQGNLYFKYEDGSEVITKNLINLELADRQILHFY